ncbi:PAS domain-containing protein [Marinobacter changyiensis]|uniref:PAS domain-containing protein n=1 Tax=Marinobacter changyiensis TaxID=2604091 RepID=UPI0012653492|nr:PAS domain S-box protein [Marinobacter changyiensis]
MTNSKELLQSPLFQSVADLTFDSVMVTEATADHKNSVIIYVNQAFTDLTGYPADEVLGKTPGLLQGPETDKAVTERLSEDLKNNRTFHGSTVNYRKDGAPFTIEWKVSPVMAGTNATHYVAVQRAVD